MEHDDPILAEIRAFREEHAKAFDYDVRAIGEDLMRRQRESGKQYAAPPAKSSGSPQLPMSGNPLFGAEAPRQSS